MPLTAEQIKKLRELSQQPYEEEVCSECWELGLGRCRMRGVSDYTDEMFIDDKDWWICAMGVCANPSVVENVGKVVRE